MGERIDPVVNDLSRPFWDAAAAGRLVLPHCRRTGRAFWPPSPSSPYGGGEVEWREVAPRGRLAASVVYRRLFQKPLAPCLPYGIGLVELDCGVRLQAHVARPDEADAPRAGDQVALYFATLPGGSVPVLHAGQAAHDRP
jgi:uncharacterized OB-fold protein